MTDRHGYCVRCHRKAKSRGLCEPHFNAEGVHGFVDAAPMREHIALLRSRGHTLSSISEASKIHRQTLVRDRDRVYASIAKAVLAVPVPDDITPSEGWLPALGSCRRLQALMAIGWTNTKIAEETGLYVCTVTRIIGGRQALVTASTAACITRAFNKLQMTPGVCNRARSRARRRHWPPPFAWDEHQLDDPKAKPAACDKRVTWVERYSELRDMGVTDGDIPKRLGVKPKSLERQLERYKEQVVA